MKKFLFTILFMFSLSTLAFAESKMTIEYINEDSQNNTKNTTKNKTNTTTKKNTTTNKVNNSPKLYTGWQNVIPNTNYWVYIINNVPVKGWQIINNYWYYFDDVSSLMYINQWKESNGKWYYLGPEGKMLINTTTPDGYQLDATGAWISNNSNSISTNTNDNSCVTDASSKYLYNRVLFNNSSSITKSIKLGEEILKKNIIKISKDGSITITNTKKYTKLTFDYLIEEPNLNNEYLLEIYINNELDGELTSFTNTKQSYTLEFDENSEIKFNWSVNTEEGSKLAKTTNLYIYNGVLFKTSE